MYGENACPFLNKLVTYNRCVVALNGHLMIRNGPTIGVWWKYMPISDQIVTYNRCVVALNVHLMIRNGPIMGVVEMHVHF